MRKMYSRNELVNIVKEGFENVDLSVKTITQKEANWEAELTIPEKILNLDVESYYCKVRQYDKDLEFVFLIAFKNNTDATISFTNIDICNITLPEEIASKLYDYKGKKASEEPSAMTPISITNATKVDDGFGTSSLVLEYLTISNLTTANAIRVSFQRASSNSIPANNIWYFEGRVTLTL